MKKILIRASFLPWETPSYFEYITKDLAWGNIGNMLFANSVIKTVMTSDDDEFLNISDKTANEIGKNPELLEKINAEYKYFLLPMANAFRKDFNPKPFISLIKKLKIPCVVVGVGFQGGVKTSFNGSPFGFDNDSKEFCRAVLEKSASIGVRGETTYDYLVKHLKMPKENIDVIGCPSMYYSGGELSLKAIKDFNDANFRISLIFSKADDAIINFMHEISGQFGNYYYIPQHMNELELAYWGHYKSNLQRKVSFPCDFSHRMYADKKVVTFINQSTWLGFLRENSDFSFGSRIHGTVAALLSGVPAMAIDVDSRVEELARHHGIPHIRVEELQKGPGPTAVDRLRDIYEKTDFSSVVKASRGNFEGYIGFLKKNSVETIYDAPAVPSPSPYEAKTSPLCYPPPLIPLNCVSSKEMSERLNRYYDYLLNKVSGSAEKTADD